MNNFFNMFKKMMPGKNSENRSKEEEDPFSDVSLSFEVTPLKSDEVLNNLVKDLKIGGELIESYESFNRGLDKLLAQYKEDSTELEYRYSKVCEKEEILPDLSKITFLYIRCK
jgi:hypothetical protein